MPVRVLTALGLVVLTALPQTSRAQPASLDGDWLGFAMTAIHLGILVPVIEDLRVQDGHADQYGWTHPMTDRGCTGTADDPPACAPPVPLGRVILSRKGQVLTPRPDGAQTNPYTHPTDAGYWPLFQLAGHEWHLRGDDRRLILARELEAEGEVLTVERVYLRAPAGAAGQLFDYLYAAQLSIARATCGLDALHDSPSDWDSFWALLAQVHPVTAQIRRISQQAERSRDETLLRLFLERGPDAVAGYPVDAGHIPEAARAAWLDHAAGLRQGIAPGPGQVVIDSLGIAAPAEIADRAAACIEYFLSY